MSRLTETLRDVCDGLRSGKGRTALSFLGVSVGMVALTVLLAVLGGLEQRARRLAEEFGAHAFAAVSEQPEAGGRYRGLAEEHAARMARCMPQCRVAPVRHFGPQRVGGRPVAVLGTDENLVAARGWRIARGRDLDAADVRGRQRHAVATSALAEAERWRIGHAVSLLGVPWTIVGVLESPGAPIDPDGRAPLFAGERAVFVPLSAARLTVDATGAERQRVDALFVRAPPDEGVAAAVAACRRLLAGPAGGGDAPACEWVTPDAVVRSVRQLQRTIALTAGSIAVLCILMSGATLMSLMLANVRERIPEIGLRRALGATRADIAGMFLLESLAVTGLAALAGAGLTIAALRAGAHLLPVPVVTGWGTCLIPLATALAVGSAFAYWPARLAARISPAEALRAE